MTDENDQLGVDKVKDVDAPSQMWRTALGRAVFGFYAEVLKNPYFMNDEYLRSLCQTENQASANYGKLVIYSFVFAVFSVATANQAIDGASYLGISISSIPYLTEFCSLVLAVMLSLLIVLALDVHTMTRMRIEIFSATGSESANMRMVHLKGNNAWIDVFIPKTVGYQSNWLHRVFQIVALCWAFFLPLAVLSIVVSAQIICVRSVMPINQFDLSNGIVWFGILISGSSILVLILVAMVPLKFTFVGSKP